jgi:hypothetical protein
MVSQTKAQHRKTTSMHRRPSQHCFLRLILMLSVSKSIFELGSFHHLRYMTSQPHPPIFPLLMKLRDVQAYISASASLSSSFPRWPVDLTGHSSSATCGQVWSTVLLSSRPSSSALCPDQYTPITLSLKCACYPNTWHVVSKKGRKMFVGAAAGVKLRVSYE